MKYRDVADLMGRLVVVTHTLSRTPPGEDLRTWLPDEIPARVGWIVGARFLQTGKRNPGGYSGRDAGVFQFDHEPDWDPPTFEIVGPAIPALLVSFWPSMRPVYVPLNGYRLALPEDGKPKSPVAASPYGWTEASKADQREVMKAHGRNAKGRWLPLRPKAISR